jgi:hypothetical protein
VRWLTTRADDEARSEAVGRGAIKTLLALSTQQGLLQNRAIGALFNCSLAGALIAPPS